MDSDAVLHALESADSEVAIFCIQRPDDPWEDLVTMRQARLHYPALQCIVLTEHENRELVVNAFRSGAKGVFCFSDYPFRMLCRCIRVIHEGQIWANAQQLHYVMEPLCFVPSLRVVNANGGRLLTAREEQVVALVADGLGNREIGKELQLSEHTIKKYLLRIFDKVGISTRVELVLYAVSRGTRREAEWLPRVAT